MAAFVAALALAACGHHGSYGWLRPAAPPAGWSIMRIPSGATLAYPRAWQRVKGDPGSASAALLGPGGRFLGYLNLTPRQGDETLAGWARFRVEHNREEGDLQVGELSHAEGLRFRDGGRGTCVTDRYLTAAGARYTEIACLVVGSRAATVAVGASPPDDFSHLSPVLQRAISTLTS